MPDLSNPNYLTTRFLKRPTGQQQYDVTVPGVASAALLFDVIGALGEPYRITVRLIHQQELNRANYLGKEASFNIASGLRAACFLYTLIAQFREKYPDAFAMLSTEKRYAFFASQYQKVQEHCVGEGLRWKRFAAMHCDMEKHLIRICARFWGK
ncbi:hypothetical protein [Herbaspirillum sp. RV1423]|uniref:hypothetical protein n=1 Tax=Herbaspirillum sp. RV1423 TaxID=1443993 RepID=UPI0004B3AAFA|nr:hypothetical protein [Herbaspirillum sp. RV1423]